MSQQPSLWSALWEKPSRRWITLGVAAAVVAGVATWALWPDPPRQREYLDATACLLTDEKGVSGEAATPVWSALQQASATDLVRAQYLEVNGPQTADNAATYVASLVDGRCGAIIAVGKAQIDAVDKSAGKHAGTRFLTVGGAAAPNVLVLDPATLRTDIADLLKTMADDAS